MATLPPPAAPVTIDGLTLESLIPPSLLIPHLRSSLPSLSSTINCPPRLSFPLSSSSNGNDNDNNSSSSSSSLLLIMPSWSLSPSLPYISVKLLTSFPSQFPSIHATLTLFHSLSGLPLASLDATSLTLLRTSAISALASLLLSPPSPKTLLLAGAGALSPHLISSHLFSLPSLSRILIWNRTPTKALTLISLLQKQQPFSSTLITLQHVDDLNKAVPLADVIVCATSSQAPLIKGRLIKPGAHLNMVGSFTNEMRECDDEAVRKGRVFVDVEAAVEDAGEIAGAIERGVIEKGHVVGTLTDLAAGKVAGRTRVEGEITVFKSVGSGVFDLLAAQLAYETYLKGTGSQTAPPGSS